MEHNYDAGCCCQDCREEDIRREKEEDIRKDYIEYLRDRQTQLQIIEITDRTK